VLLFRFLSIESTGVSFPNLVGYAEKTGSCTDRLQVDFSAAIFGKMKEIIVPERIALTLLPMHRMSRGMGLQFTRLDKQAGRKKRWGAFFITIRGGKHMKRVAL